MFSIILHWINYLIFIYFVTVQSFYVVLVFLSIPELISRYREVRVDRVDRMLKSESIPNVSIVMPLYNMANSIGIIINCMLALSYRRKRVIVVNDGSTDGGMEYLINAYKLIPTPPLIPPAIPAGPIKQMYRSASHPELYVVDKLSSGKADSTNIGINASPDPFYIALDTDTVINDRTLLALVRSSLIKPHLVACGGTIGVGNECQFRGYKLDKIFFPKKLLPSVQGVEYLRAFLFGRLGMNSLGGNLVLSGAFGLFDREIVTQVGGYEFNIGDDIDVVVKIHRLMRDKKKPYLIDFVPDLIAWTEVPADWGSLARQRERWHRGLLNVVWANRRAIFNYRYGPVGMVTLPALTFIEGLAPIVETSGYFVVFICIGLGIVNWPFAFWYLFLAIFFPIVITCVCIMMEITSFRNYEKVGNGLKLFFYAVLEQCGFRQTFMLFRFWSFYKWFKGDRGWGEMKRGG